MTDAFRRSFFADAEGPRLASARAGNVIGGGDWGEDRLVPDIMRAALAGEQVRVRNPSSIRPWQHVLNPLSGYLVLAQALWDAPELAEGWNFGPADEDARPVGWIVQRIAARWPEELRWVQDDGPHPHEARYLKLDSSKARARLGWRPRSGLGRHPGEHRELVQRAAYGADMRAVTLGQIEAFQYAASLVMSETLCRFCRAPVEAVFADLGMSPLANSYLPPERANSMEPFYPLRALVCGKCFLVQLEEFETPERIFSDYAYFSSYSSSWLEHSRHYSELMIERLGLGERQPRRGDRLQRRLPAAVLPRAPDPRARDRAGGQRRQGGAAEGHPHAGRVLRAGDRRARWRGESAADLLLGNNVLAHVPDLNDFVAGMKILLKPGGVITMEFPHLMQPDRGQPVGHDLSRALLLLLVPDRQPRVRGPRSAAVRCRGAAHPRRVAAHLRLPCGRCEKPETERGPRAARARARAPATSSSRPTSAMAGGSSGTSARSCASSIDLKEQGLRIVGYGAPAKGNTLLNYCGVRRDFIDYTCDLNPHKQGHFLPGSHIPIRSPDALREDRPDVVLILPWNLKDEIMEQLGFIREWGGRFAARTPELTLLS